MKNCKAGSKHIIYSAVDAETVDFGMFVYNADILRLLGVMNRYSLDYLSAKKCFLYTLLKIPAIDRTCSDANNSGDFTFVYNHADFQFNQ